MEHSFLYFPAKVPTGELGFCISCGILKTITNYDKPCPPWKEKTKGENSNAERAHEAQIIIELKDLIRCFKSRPDQRLIEYLALLIQKHDACVGDSTERRNL